MYGDVIGVSNTESYQPYVGSKLYVNLFGLIWIRYKIVSLRGKNH
jgi:hypothetical protein